jgi:hypothetical protein
MADITMLLKKSHQNVPSLHPSSLGENAILKAVGQLAE